MKLLGYNFKLSELIFNLVMMFFVLIAFIHIANRVQVCDLTIETSYPCGIVYNYTIHGLDYYALNYYIEYYNNNLSNVVRGDCTFKLYPINLR